MTEGAEATETERMLMRQPDAPLPDSIPMVRREGDEAEESGQVATGLSAVFDSSAATMRLAAMTSSPEEVEEFAKTLKVARPTADALSQVAPPIAKPKAAERPMPAQAHRSDAANHPGKGGNLPLIAILALVLIGLVLAFIF